jgi:ATP-dependent DNA helicase RecG
LSENQLKIIELIKVDKYISAKMIAENIEISSRKVEENISKLKKLNLLKRIGPAKGGYWEIIDN